LSKEMKSKTCFHVMNIYRSGDKLVEAPMWAGPWTIQVYT
jgi:hypothetical protein